MRRAAATGGVALAMAPALGTAPASAAPVAGTASIAVERSCVPYGDPLPVSGGGFPPRTAVTVSVPLRQASPPLPWNDYGEASVVTDATGAFRAEMQPLRGPGLPPGGPPYQARLVVVRLAGAGDATSLHAAFVLAQPAACAVLEGVRAAQARGFAFSLAGRTLTVALSPRRAGGRPGRRVFGRRVTAACGTTTRPRLRDTVHVQRRWPRGAQSVTFRFGRDIAARARWCLIERADGGDVAVARFG